VFRVVIWMTTGIRPRQWAAVHRKHHAFTDIEGDPHSPLREGFAMVQFANVALYRKVAKDEDQVARYARDLPADRWDRLFFDHALLGLGIGIALLCTVVGWKVGLVVAAVHTVSYLLLNAAINAIGHYFGTQPYGNTARNNQWLAYITAGEGLHNNHHAAPTSAKFALNPGEVDIGWWLVRLLVWRGWAEVRLDHDRVMEKLAA
jgi:stearoyl-CoA desaturase (delta-9 desaturase)